MGWGGIHPITKILIALGVACLILGILWQVVWQTGFYRHLHLGRLPGDIAIENDSVKFYFPITTCILSPFVIINNLHFRRISVQSPEDNSLSIVDTNAIKPFVAKTLCSHLGLLTANCPMLRHSIATIWSPINVRLMVYCARADLITRNATASLLLLIATITT